VEKITPLPEWQGLYEEVCQELETEFGLTL
jgi:hypothetical protein